MPWLKLDDLFLESPKILALTDDALRAHLWGLLFCAKNLTDGYIPAAVAHTKTTDKQRSQLTKTLPGQHNPLWESAPDGYRIHDYLEYNPTREYWEQTYANKVAAGKAGGQASAQARAKAKAQAGAQAGAQAKTNPVPVPVENRREGNGSGFSGIPVPAPQPPGAPTASPPAAPSNQDKDQHAAFEEAKRKAHNLVYHIPETDEDIPF